ncbi:MAG: ImmA/IrrE family metallo-endopeptidase [Firmicutes bacterium]|nr:ImmA/IrrE family metallo-endopeptidase [Bacillota bacterium]
MKTGVKDFTECAMWGALSGLALKRNILLEVVNFKEKIGTKGKINGVIVGIEGEFYILIDDRVPNDFKFEVLAHELAHYQLHHSKAPSRFNVTKYLKDKDYRRSVEAEADEFAERLISYVRHRMLPAREQQ